MEVVSICILEVSGLTDPEYRFGDITGSLFGAVTGQRRDLIPYVISQFEGREECVKTNTRSASANGHAAFGETLLLPLPDMSHRQLVVDVRQDVGKRNLVRGDPLFGSCVVNVDKFSDQTLTLDLNRDGETKGKIKLKLIVSQRVERIVILGKTALLPFPVVSNFVGTHWGLMVKDADGSVEIYEMAATGTDANEFGVVGPHGLIAHNVPDKIWDEWKNTISSNRANQGFFPEEAIDKQGFVETDEFQKLVVSRPMDAFEALQEEVGTTLRTSDEIDEFIRSWTSTHTAYSWRCNCQKLAKDLFEFLTCGRGLDKTALHEALELLGGGIVAGVAVAATTG